MEHPHASGRALLGLHFPAIFRAALLSLGLMAASAGAATITQTLTALGGTQYRSDYRIAVSTGDAPVREFTIFFDAGRYTNLSLLSSPTGADSLLIAPDTGIPASGFLDVLLPDPGLSAGMSLSGFTVSFDFAGGGLPVEQPFDIVDPDTFAVIGSGLTMLADEQGPHPAPIPEPHALALFIVCIGAMRAVMRRPRVQ